MSFARYHAEMNDSWLLEMVRSRSRADGVAMNCLLACFELPEHVVLLNTEIVHELNCIAKTSRPRASRLSRKAKKSSSQSQAASLKGSVGVDDRRTSQQPIDTTESRLKAVAKRIERQGSYSSCIIAPVYDEIRMHWGMFLLDRQSRTCLWGDSLDFGPPSVAFIQQVVKLGGLLWSEIAASDFKIMVDINILFTNHKMIMQRGGWECGFYVCGAIANMSKAECAFAAPCRGKFRKLSTIEKDAETVRRVMMRAIFSVAAEVPIREASKTSQVTDFDVGERVRRKLSLNDLVSRDSHGTSS